jgi:hypothetical protein
VASWERARLVSVRLVGRVQVEAVFVGLVALIVGLGFVAISEVWGSFFFYEIKSLYKILFFQ